MMRIKSMARDMETCVHRHMINTRVKRKKPRAISNVFGLRPHALSRLLRLSVPILYYTYYDIHNNNNNML